MFATRFLRIFLNVITTHLLYQIDHEVSVGLDTQDLCYLALIIVPLSRVSQTPF